MRDLFGGDGDFLALPSQCVPDSHDLRMPARSFGSLLGLPDMAWRALDDRARRTIDPLAWFALAGQPLPGAALTLERPEVVTKAALAGLSPMLAGWSASDYAKLWPSDSTALRLTEREVKGEVNMPEAVRTTTAATSEEEVLENAEASVRKETTLGIEDGSFKNVAFDERLSQEI